MVFVFNAKSIYSSNMAAGLCSTFDQRLQYRILPKQASHGRIFLCSSLLPGNHGNPSESREWLPFPRTAEHYSTVAFHIFPSCLLLKTVEMCRNLPCWTFRVLAATGQWGCHRHQAIFTLASLILKKYELKQAWDPWKSSFLMSNRKIILHGKGHFPLQGFSGGLMASLDESFNFNSLLAIWILYTYI